MMGTTGAVTQPLESLVLETAQPHIEGLAADSEVAAGLGDVAGHFLSVAKDREASLHHSLLVSLGHLVS